MRPDAVLVLLLIAGAATAGDFDNDLGGYTKLRVTGQSYPDDSLFRDIAGSKATDVFADARLNVDARSGRWSFASSYQLLGQAADSLPLTGLPTDDRRLMDLTAVLDASGDSAILHRLDRLWVGYTSEKTVVRVGRQALSWGNGLFYAPLDLVNPFDPASIDTEYKAGDDMLYLQYLKDSGDDLQAAYVARRDSVTGSSNGDQATIAVKYHGFAGFGEYDLLIARSYGDPVLGVGIGRSIGGAVWSADLAVTDTALDTYVQLVTNLTYSWTWGGKNVSGAVEYYFNGFGQRGGRYAPSDVAANPDLGARRARAELFAIGRHYVAGSVTVEMSPLWTVTPTVLANTGDPSALLQLVTNYSLSDDMSLLGSINLPLGANGSEFGGIPSDLPGRYLSGDIGFFAQFAWYF